MELITEIVKAFCFIAIILSISQFLIPNDSMSKCIRFIIGLMFIAAVIKPFLTDGYDLNLDIITSPDLSKLEDLSDELSEAVSDDYIDTLCDEILTALKESDINAVSVDIKTRTDEYNNTDTTVIDSVEVTVKSGENADDVKETVSQLISVEEDKINVTEL